MGLIKKLKNSFRGKKDKERKAQKAAQKAELEVKKSVSEQTMSENEKAEKKKRSNSLSRIFRKLSRGKSDKPIIADKYKNNKNDSNGDSGVSMNTTPGSVGRKAASDKENGSPHVVRLLSEVTQAKIESHDDTSVEDFNISSDEQVVTAEIINDKNAVTEVTTETKIETKTDENGTMQQETIRTVTTTTTTIESAEQENNKKEEVASEKKEELTKTDDDDLPIERSRIDEIHEMVRIMEAKYMQPSVKLDTKDMATILEDVRAENELDDIFEQEFQKNKINLIKSPLISQTSATPETETTTETENAKNKPETEKESVPDVVQESIKQGHIESIDGLMVKLQKESENVSQKIDQVPPKETKVTFAATNGVLNGKSHTNGALKSNLKEVNSNNNNIRKPIKSRQQMQVEKRYFKFGATIIIAMLAIGVYFIVGNGPMNVMTRTFRK